LTCCSTPSFPFAAAAREIGVKHYTLAFVTAQSGCEASWGGVAPVKDGLLDEYLISNINELRAAGGNVIVSFGGASGAELAQSCSSVSALAAQYRAVIKRYNLTHLDFDIEGAAMADTAANTRRSQAIALLQQEAARDARQLVISYTLPVSTAGLTQHGINILQNAVGNNVAISVVNIMAMNYGGNTPPDRMGQNAIDAAEATLSQMRNVFGDRTASQLRLMLGLTPMIGMNDITTEIFTPADADKVLNYARTSNIGRLAMWSMSRDNQCPGNPTQTYVSPTCSSIAQQEFEFAKKFKAFTTLTKQTLAPVADAWVQGADAFRNTNYGASTEMQIKRTLNPGAGRGRRGFLRFDTSGVTGERRVRPVENLRAADRRRAASHRDDRAEGRRHHVGRDDLDVEQPTSGRLARRARLNHGGRREQSILRIRPHGIRSSRARGRACAHLTCASSTKPLRE
jgi:hypothetical protein